MSKGKVFAIVASAGLWLATSGGVLADAVDGANIGRSCAGVDRVLHLLESPTAGLQKISTDVRDAKAGIEGISSSLETGFTDVEEGLRLLAEKYPPFDISIVVDERACASGATQCQCRTSQGTGFAGLDPPGPSLDASSTASVLRRGHGTSGGIGEASTSNCIPVAVNILVSRHGVPVTGLGSSAFTFSLAFAPFDGPTLSSGRGSDSFRDAGNGVYQIWLWPGGSWVTGTYVGRLDATNGDGLTVNILVPIRIQ